MTTNGRNKRLVTDWDDVAVASVSGALVLIGGTWFCGPLFLLASGLVGLAAVAIARTRKRRAD